jgi:hypothetical protein
MVHNCTRDPSTPCHLDLVIKIHEGNTFLNFRIIHPAITSNVVGIVIVGTHNQL